MKRICIVSAKRTPQGRFLGKLAKCSAVELATVTGRAALENIGSTPENAGLIGQGATVTELIDRVIVGNVLGAGLGMNIARQIGVGLGVPVDRPAFTVNMMCASGMQALILAAQSIAVGESSVVLCGGTESMSQAPYVSDRARAGLRLGHGKLIDTVLRDGLVDAFDNQHMGVSAERLAERFGITREAQDRFAFESQQKTARAIEEGSFDAELTPVAGLENDEHPRPDTTLEKLAALGPAFQADAAAAPGTITAGNASGINDGAAMMLVCSEATAARRGWQPLAFITAYATAGCDPKLMGLGPVHATHRLCDRAGSKPTDYELVELNEAFAAQALTCIKELKLDPARVNVNGGAIALGHPIGASGARIVVHLAHQLAAGKAKNALATLCVGGGMGAAVALEV